MTPTGGGGNGEGPTLVIGLLRAPDGTLIVHGPVNDMALALGLLEVAKQLVIDHVKAQQQRAVVPVRAMPGILPVRGGG